MQQHLVLHVQDGRIVIVIGPRPNDGYQSITTPTLSSTVATPHGSGVGQQAVSPPDKLTSGWSVVRTIRGLVIALVPLFVVGSIGMAVEPSKALEIISQLPPIIEKIVDLVAHFKGIR